MDAGCSLLEGRDPIFPSAVASDVAGRRGGSAAGGVVRKDRQSTIYVWSAGSICRPDCNREFGFLLRLLGPTLPRDNRAKRHNIMRRPRVGRTRGRQRLVDHEEILERG